MYKIEKIFKHEKLTCVVIFTANGHRCGYVAVEKTSPLFGINYMDDLNKPELLKELNQTEIGKRGLITLFCWDGKKVTPEILFNIHGGITYANGNSCYPITRPRPLWWFGFDCAHFGDRKDKYNQRKYFPKVKIDDFMFSEEVIRDQDYVIHECKNLAEQIRCVESVY
jgi:hypothetical protein